MTLSVECASRCAASATKSGFSTSAARDAAHISSENVFNYPDARSHRRSVPLASEANTDTFACESPLYAHVEGTREQKLAALDDITDFATVEWQECPADWQSPFRPPGGGRILQIGRTLNDLIPWRHSGVAVEDELGRLHPTLRNAGTRRWHTACCNVEDRSQAFRETGDRKIGSNPPMLVALKLESRNNSTPGC